MHGSSFIFMLHELDLMIWFPEFNFRRAAFDELAEVSRSPYFIIKLINLSTICG